MTRRVLALLAPALVAGCFAATAPRPWVVVGDMLCDPSSRLNTVVHGTYPGVTVDIYTRCVPRFP